MTTRLLVGDVFQRMAELEDHSFDLIVTSPPFLALRSYLPDDHPDKALEIGSEATPADYLDTLLALTAEWRRLLAPHGSIAIELGDTYAGSGGGGGDYYEGGFRYGQPGFTGSASASRDALREANARHWRDKNTRRDEWPLDKSLTGIPTLYAWSLAYGRNLLTGQESPAGRWRIRNLKPWIRSNPPVGSLGSLNARERSATSYITVACVGASRWFDLDAVRTPAQPQTPRNTNGPKSAAKTEAGAGTYGVLDVRMDSNPGGAPPLDWWHPVDAVIDQVIDQRSGKANGSGGQGGSGLTQDASGTVARRFGQGTDNVSVGARGVHIRRALTAAGYLQDGDFYDVSPKGYAGAHYAVWPPELVRLLIDEMCPRRVCRECGEPSRRIVEVTNLIDGKPMDEFPSDHEPQKRSGWAEFSSNPHTKGIQAKLHINNNRLTQERRQAGWSDCGHNAWRPGRVLDPFSGSGTTLAVASGMGRDSVGIDLDPRNADLTLERVGMFLEVDYGTKEATA